MGTPCKFPKCLHFWYSLLHQNAAAALSVSISPPHIFPNREGGLENPMRIIQISAIGLRCRSDRSDYGGEYSERKRQYKHTPLPALTELTRMPHIQRYAQRWYNYPMKNKAPQNALQSVLCSFVSEWELFVSEQDNVIEYLASIEKVATFSEYAAISSQERPQRSTQAFKS